MRNHSTLLAASVAAALLVSSTAWAADMAMAGTYTNPSEVKWGDAPPVFTKGAKMAVLEGDPGKPGPFVVRLMMPANYKIAPHWHTSAEDLTIISGAFYLAEGDKMDMKGAHELKPGGFHHLPGKAHHFAYTKAATVVQVNSTGPFDLVYLDPKDDPSKMAAAPAKDAAKPMAKDAKKKM